MSELTIAFYSNLSSGGRAALVWKFTQASVGSESSWIGVLVGISGGCSALVRAFPQLSCPLGLGVWLPSRTPSFPVESTCAFIFRVSFIVLPNSRAEGRSAHRSKPSS